MMSRRHNDPQTPHERARTLGSDRLDSALTIEDAAWLDRHLAACLDCASVVEAYARDRRLLRSMPAPEAPRDLWARTSAGLDRERGRRAPVQTRNMGARLRWEAAAGIVAVLVVGILVGRTLLPSGETPTTGLASPASSAGAAPVSSIGAEATPIAVPPGEVAWVGKSSDGSYSVNVADLAAVCAQDAAPSPDCAPLDGGARRITSLKDHPDSVILAPNLDQAAVVNTGTAATGGSISIVSVNRAAVAPAASPAPVGASPSPRPPARPTPSATPAPAVTPTPSTDPERSPSGAESPSPDTSQAPAGSPPASGGPSGPASSTPSPSPSAEPSQLPTPSPTTVTPTDTPAPTLARTLAIISDVIIVGGAPVYDPDGQWLAFSARPAHGRIGPDVYVWHLGDEKARPLTRDHGSVFSGWLDGRILASRGQAAIVDGVADAATAKPVSFLLDPATAKERPLEGFHGWRPVVDPSGRWVVYWTGTLAFDAESRTFSPADGSLVIDRWAAFDGSSPPADSDPQPLLAGRTENAARGWDVRWDPTGGFVGAWIADPLAPTIGRLSLVPIDRTTGRVDPAGRPVLKDAPALPGFAIGDGRITWATADGQDGEGSRLTVLAWKGPDAGRTRTEAAPSHEDIVVVR